MRRKLASFFLLSTSLMTPTFALDLPVPGTQLPKTAPTKLPTPASPLTLARPMTQYASIPVDMVMGHHARRLLEEDPDAAYPSRYLPPLNLGVPELPSPSNLPPKAHHLSLTEAIALALRNNPNVKNAELQRIVDKFGLETAIFNRYALLWSPLAFTQTMQHGAGMPTWNATTGVSVTGMEGTQVGVTYDNDLNGGPGAATLSVTQPLLQGFGRALNRITYDNAITSEAENKLTFKNSVITVVVSVINNYRALVQAYQSLAISKASVKSQLESVKQMEIQVKTGQMSQSDLIQQQEQLESTKLNVVQDANSLRDAYQSFLQSLGLVPSAHVIIDQQIHVAKKRAEVPSERKCIAIALKHNIAYQTALLQLQTTARAVITAKDAKRWQLNLTGSTGVAGGDQVSNPGDNPKLVTSLSIPLNNVPQQATYVGSKVALEQAKLTLEQTKEDLVRTVDEDWQNIQNEYQQIYIAKLAVKMQEQTLKNAKLKLHFGKTSVFEVNSLEASLLTQQTSLVSTQIAFLNAITTLHQELGTTLQERHIKLRY